MIIGTKLRTMKKRELKKNLVICNEKNRLYGLKKPIIGLTGGIATGKTTVSNFLKNQGLSVICADSLIKDIYKYPSTIEFIQNNFPNCVKKDNNVLQIDFKTLKKLAFNNETVLNTLENFLHPLLKEAFLGQAEKYNDSFIIYDITLLFEKNMADLFDHIICVHSDQATQLKRVQKRDKISKDLAKKIVDKQWPIDEKIEKSHTTIRNSKTIEHLESEINIILRKLFITQ